MHRFRFYVPGDDPRPMAFPPTGPFWCTGFSETHCVVVAYAPDLKTLTGEGHWPDAEQIEDGGEQDISFTSRFPCPDWWSDGNNPAPEE